VLKDGQIARLAGTVIDAITAPNLFGSTGGNKE